ncbi:hypothetical protein AYO45_04630 [Gammaproteobacteria bacterium SCGC AG-212-F23]|nr:hypothetical protein AYO45_04630 [Gammaproteobacteria bacterium SCGC AG-212-F23]
MLPSSAELEYFLEVTQSLNLSRASERLGISQPSLSLAIKRLEKSVGTALFIRHKQGVTLTQAGKQLLAHVRQLLQQWENAKSQALSSAEEIQGQFTIGCNSVIAIYLVSKFLPDLLERYPKLEIQLKHEISRKITEKVINLSIDIGIVINPIQHPDLIIRKLGTDKTTFWVGKGHKKIQDLHSGKSVIICNPETMQAEFLLKKIKKSGIHFDRILTSDSMEVVASLTASGCGVGILPERVVQSLFPGELKIVAKTPSHFDELCLIYRNENRHIKAVQKILSSIITSL